MKNEVLEFYAEFCRTFAHAKRLEILDILKRGEMTVSEMQKEIGASRAYTSQQLTLMRAKGVLKARREGQNIYYSIASEKISHACTLMQEALAQLM